MRSNHVLLLILLGLTLSIITTISAEQDMPQENEDSDTVQMTEVAEVPLLGWYLIPALGTMRRRRHELNNRNYERNNEIN